MGNFTGLLVAVFVIGYFFITIEHRTKINKASVALLMAILCWVIQFASPSGGAASLEALQHHLASISQIVLFLLGALAVVETINRHQGFDFITNLIHFKSKKTMLWVVSLLAFFLSAVLDNLTTTVVMITLLKKLIPKSEDRLLIGGGVVIAANAGGAWTPIGDVTTTMLWIGGQLSSAGIIKSLFLPSAICFVVATFLLSLTLTGDFEPKPIELQTETEKAREKFFFSLALPFSSLCPFLKPLLGFPPFMGMLLALSIFWIITDYMHSGLHDRSHLRLPQILGHIDMSSILFFLGILLCIGALDAHGILNALAEKLDASIGNLSVIAAFIGVFSAIIDNVPLVAAAMGMYELSQYPVDHTFWKMIAYTAGTGGSMLIIGSAAGVMYMGMENVDFFWYIRRITLPAALSFLAGFFFYLFFQ